ncbi:MAG: GtrA family protein [Rubrivivax sp.]|nr:GtrA family protein [Rubrivivax sp.]
MVDAFVQSEVVDGDGDGAAAVMLRPVMNDPGASRGQRPSSLTRRARLGWFIAVGCLAALVHWSVVVALVDLGGWRPLVANVAGWAVAFTVSFAGHHRLTFRDVGAPVLAAGSRFVLVSFGGFCINEATYAALLGWTGLRYDAVLAVVLVLVAGITYLLSRHWVFLRSPGH